MRIFCLSFLFILSVQSLAQHDLSLDGSVRLRYEYMDNYSYKSLGDPSDQFVLLNTKAGVNYRYGKVLNVKLSVQDAQSFGWALEDESYVSPAWGLENNPQKDYLELHESYIQYFPLSSLSITAGRQVFKQGNSRVFWTGAWKNSGKWLWDGARVSFVTNFFTVNAIAGMTVIHEPVQSSFTHRHGYRAAGLYVTYTPFSFMSIEPFAAYKGDRDGKASYNKFDYFYGGARSTAKIGILSLDGTFAVQGGKKELLSGKDQSRRGFGGHLGAWAKLNDSPLSPSFGVDYGYASGDDTTTGDRSEAFEGIYGGAFKTNGAMGLGSWSAMRDLRFMAEIKPITKGYIGTEMHLFFTSGTPSKWKGIALTDASHLGTELDLHLRYNIGTYGQLYVGGGYFLGGDALMQESDALFAFAQTTVNLKKTVFSKGKL